MLGNNVYSLILVMIEFCYNKLNICQQYFYQMRQDRESYYMGRFCKRPINNRNNIETQSICLGKLSGAESGVYNDESIRQSFSQSFILSYSNNFEKSKQHLCKLPLSKNTKNTFEPLMKNQIIKIKISQPKKVINNTKNQIYNKSVLLTPYQKMINEKQQMKQIIGQRAKKATLNNFNHDSIKIRQQKPIKKLYKDLQSYRNQIIRQPQKTNRQISYNQLQIFDHELIAKSLLKKQKKIHHKYTPQQKIKSNQEIVNINNSDSQIISLKKINKNSDINYNFNNNQNKILQPDFGLKKYEIFKSKYFQLKNSKFSNFIQNNKKRPMSGVNKYQSFSVVLERNQTQKNQLSNLLKSKSICLNQHQKSPSRPSTCQKGFNRKKYKEDFIKKQVIRIINNNVNNEDQPRPWAD